MKGLIKMEIKNYTQLPDLRELKNYLLCQAALDITMLPEEKSWLRITSYFPNYLEGVDMFHIDNGASDHLYILFSTTGIIIKGFDHESILSPYANEDEIITPGIYDTTPPELLALLDTHTEKDDVTFCVWYDLNNSTWRKGIITVPEGYKDGDDGEGFLLGYIFTTPDDWLDWAQHYYGDKNKDIDITVVKKYYRKQIITHEDILSMNTNADVEYVFSKLMKLGYSICNSK